MPGSVHRVNESTGAHIGHRSPVTLPSPRPEQSDAGSSYCGTLGPHRRALSELGSDGRGLLYHICHLFACFAILCSCWLRSDTPTCSPKALLGLSKQTAGRNESGEGEGRGGRKRGEENQNLIKDTFAPGPLKITNS